jgi:hypothetical protein
MALKTDKMNFSKWGIHLSEMRNERWPDPPPKSLVECALSKRERVEEPALSKRQCGEWETWYRAVTVSAPVQIVFRWICQLRAAPYSYDWIDNFGRPSPRRLIDGLDHLEIGQKVMMIFRVDDFLIDRFITIVPLPRARFLCSDLRITYQCVSLGANRTRLMVRVQICYPGHPFRSIISALLQPGDLLMMRKQLLTLKHLAEEQFSETAR